MSQNLISQAMTDAQRDAMLADLDAFDTKFNLYKTSLTPAEIGRLSKLAASDIGMLELAQTYALQNPGSIPASLGVSELSSDIALAEQIVQVDAKAQQKANLTHNSLIAVMSDGWGAARKIYRIALAEGRTPGNSAFLDAFGARFNQEPPPPPPPTPPTPPPGP
jgi:hypothetical protein